MDFESEADYQKPGFGCVSVGDEEARKDGGLSRWDITDKQKNCVIVAVSKELF